jgi:hypothetical protein
VRVIFPDVEYSGPEVFTFDLEMPPVFIFPEAVDDWVLVVPAVSDKLVRGASRNLMYGWFGSKGWWLRNSVIIELIWESSLSSCLPR